MENTESIRRILPQGETFFSYMEKLDGRIRRHPRYVPVNLKSSPQIHIATLKNVTGNLGYLDTNPISSELEEDHDTYESLQMHLGLMDERVSVLEDFSLNVVGLLNIREQGRILRTTSKSS